MGCFKFTYQDEDTSLGQNWKVYASGVEKTASNRNFRIDYYPFGMAMPGRSFNSNSYRYGFNGMEKDDELKGSGNSYTTEFRQYDSRLGRWLSLDPKTHVEYSPYSAFDNNPIYYIDPEGANSEGENKEDLSNSNESADNKSEFEGNATDKSGNKGILTSEKEALKIMADVGKTKEVAAYVLEDKNGNQIFYVQDYTNNGPAYSGNQPMSKSKNGKVRYKEINGQIYKVVAQVHTHIASNPKQPDAKYEGPSGPDADFSTEYNMPVFTIGETEVSRIGPGIGSKGLSRAVYKWDSETKSYKGPINVFKIGRTKDLLGGQRSIQSYLKKN